MAGKSCQSKKKKILNQQKAFRNEGSKDHRSITSRVNPSNFDGMDRASKYIDMNDFEHVLNQFVFVTL